MFQSLVQIASGTNSFLLQLLVILCILINHSLPILLLIPELFPSFGSANIDKFIPRIWYSTSEVLSFLGLPPSSSGSAPLLWAAVVILNYLIPQTSLKLQTTQEEPALRQNTINGKLTSGHSNQLLFPFVCSTMSSYFLSYVVQRWHILLVGRLPRQEPLLHFWVILTLLFLNAYSKLQSSAPLYVYLSQDSNWASPFEPRSSNLNQKEASGSWIL